MTFSPGILSDNGDFHPSFAKLGQNILLPKLSHGNPDLFWEAGKTFLQGKVISYVSSYKKNTLKQYQVANKWLHVAQTLLNRQNTPEYRKLWYKAKWLFDLWAENQEHIKLSNAAL